MIDFHHRPLLLALASVGMIALMPQAYAQGDNGETAIQVGQVSQKAKAIANKKNVPLKATYSENCPLLKARKVMVLRTPLGPVLYAFIDGFVARIVWAFCIGEARRTALAVITCSE